jgi:ATP-dependent protease Clp ATPase subunit
MVPEQQKVKEDVQRVIEIFKSSEAAIRPHFILTGPSGCGKSHIINEVAKEADINYFEINAAQLTKEGTSGNSLSKALTPLVHNGAQLTICFVDEFDKLFISGNSNGDLAHETTNGVQNEFLKIVEGDTTSVFGDYGKYVEVPVDNVLFIFAGAFNGEANLTIDRLRDFGIKTEFLGRVGLIYNLEKLSLKSMFKALQNSAILSHYLELFPEVDREKAEKEIMTEVAKVHTKNTLGIRLLNTFINQYFINDGKIDLGEAKKTSFQSTLSFKASRITEEG